MKKTVFYDSHVRMGGRMIPFAGFEMPVEFSGVKDEHIQVRTKAGVFDVSHMGEIRVTGRQAERFVQRMTSNDIRRIDAGQVQYSCLPNGRGGIVDDLLIYKFSTEEYLFVVNASNTEKDWNWLNENNKEGIELVNESDAISQLAVQGPLAGDVLQKITPLNLYSIPGFSFDTATIAGISNVLISNTGYTGSGGFELYFENKVGRVLMEAIFDAGDDHVIKPIGLAARDTLRLESGFCLYGNDIDDTTSPLEAGLGWITRFVEGNDFIDRDYLEKQKREGLRRKLVGFELMERGIARKDYPILNGAGEEIGKVTSGTMSPFTSKSVGMGYINKGFFEPGTSIFIGIRNKMIPATVARPPFF